MHNVDVRNVSLGQMMYFVKTAEFRNITMAAEYFNLTQPTLTKKIQSLESQLDLQLFIRTNKIISLTPAGQYLYDNWKQNVSQIEEQIQYAHVLQNGQSKSLVLACLDSFRPEYFFMPIINHFSSKYPDVHTRIESDAAQEIRLMLIRGEVDVIFSILYDFEGKDEDQIQWKRYDRSTHCVCMRKDNPLAQKETLFVSDLKNSDFICISPHVLPEYSQMIMQLCKEYGFVPNITKYVASAHSLTLNINSPNDIFICGDYYADLNTSDNVIVPLENTENGFVVAWRKDNKKKILKQFLNTVDAYIENEE